MILPEKFGNGAFENKSGLVLNTFQAIKIPLRMQKVGSSMTIQNGNLTPTFSKN